MLLPYNVERPARLFPYITYSIIGINVFIFLLTLMIANTHLPADRIQGRALIQQLTSGGIASSPPMEAPQGLGSWDEEEEEEEAPPLAGEVPNTQIRMALAQTMGGLKNPTSEDLRKIWKIRNVNSKFVLEPHYSTLETLAYRPGDRSPWTKLMGLFGSMFLHAGIEHLVGNLFLLWVFGRALEDALGDKYFAGIYLACGVAATLVFHIITMAFFAEKANIPLLGASGAISGVLGLFIVRFFRTRVRIFYLSLPLIIAIPGVGAVVLLGLILYYVAWLLLFSLIFGISSASITLSLVVFALSLFFFGRNWAWGRFTAPSLWFIGAYMVLFNVLPALREMLGANVGSTAYWAHMGGFTCGALYAFLIGGLDDGKSEYALEDAQTSLHNLESREALTRAEQLLAKAPDNPAALEVAARALDSQGQGENAVLKHLQAIEGYWRRGERNAATNLYCHAVELHPALPLAPGLLASLAGQLVREGNFSAGAAALVRIIEEHPQSPEAEIALLRAAQMWMREFDDPAEASRLYQAFLSTYPHSQYASQAKLAATVAANVAVGRPPSSPPAPGE